MCITCCNSHGLYCKPFADVFTKAAYLRPWVFVLLGFEPATSCSAHGHLSNWAIQVVAFKLKELDHTELHLYCQSCLQWSALGNGN